MSELVRVWVRIICRWLLSWGFEGGLLLIKGIEPFILALHPKIRRSHQKAVQVKIDFFEYSLASHFIPWLMPCAVSGYGLFSWPDTKLHQRP